MSNGRDRSWGALVEALRHYDLAFVLGAGTSYPLMPNWDEFVRKLANEANFEWPREFGRNLPTVTTLIRQHCDDEGRWQNILRTSLYSLDDDAKRKGLEDISVVEMNKVRANEMAVQRQDFIDYLSEQGITTLPSIVDLCAYEIKSSKKENISRNVRKWKRNERIGAILTYNFDALLQFYDRARHGSPRMLRTIERASSRRHVDKIPVYHLHGYLWPVPNSYQDAPEGLVFCEDEYHRRTDEPFSYAMTSMLWALREFACVFVGCSMTDELMRRTLYRSGNEYLKHLKRRTGGIETRHFATMKRKSNRVDDLVEQDLKSLGVRPLWVDSHQDLPKRFKELNEHFAAARREAPRAT